MHTPSWIPAVALVLTFAASSPAREAASPSAITDDWLLQDYMAIELPPALEQEKQTWREQHLKSPESRREDPVLAKLSCFTSPTDSTIEQRMLARVLAELGPKPADLTTALDQLVQSHASANDPRWKSLYLQACELRRAARLAPLLSRWTQFVFNEHPHVGASYKYNEALSTAKSGGNRSFHPGAAINVLEMTGTTGQIRPLIEDKGGILRNPDVSFDGKRLLFAWKKSDRSDDFHLYEMSLDTGAIRQLTSGQGIADFEGIYLPDGNILFNSTRCFQTVDCNWVEVSNLYLADANGQSIRRIGYDQVHTVFPSLADDGRVLFTRWEYNDRAQIHPQVLFQMNPDGTAQQALYGGSSWFPTNTLQARTIPGSRKLVAIVTGHHRPPQGKLALIDPSVGTQEGHGVQLIAPIRPTDYVRVDKYALDGIQFQHPYPVTEDSFLVTAALPDPDGKTGRFNAYFIDAQGRRELLVQALQSGDGIGCRQILPLAARSRPPLRPSTTDNRKTTGTFFIQDIYQGPGLKGIPRGTIKQLRVVALEYRAAAIGNIPNQKGRGGSSEVSTPIAIGNGSWDVKVVLGTATVHADGSAMFEAPARTPVYFQALDAKNHVVQTMRSWATLMPGETQSCVGCHEDRNSAPRADAATTLAAQSGAQTLTPFYGPPRGFSFPREIQPILDRHCIRCHTGAPDKPLDLTATSVPVGTTKRKFSQSYLTLTHAKKDLGDWTHPLVNWIDSMSEPEMLPPYHRGSATSKLITILDQGHEGVKLSREEMDKFTCWIDLLVPYCGDYLESNTWSAPELDRYAKAMAQRTAGNADLPIGSYNASSPTTPRVNAETRNPNDD